MILNLEFRIWNNFEFGIGIRDLKMLMNRLNGDKSQLKQF